VKAAAPKIMRVSAKAGRIVVDLMFLFIVFIVLLSYLRVFTSVLTSARMQPVIIW
jgi:hypothetical protein